VTAPARLDRDSLPAIHDLCRRSIRGAPPAVELSIDELEGALFATEQATVIRGDPAVGVVATVEWESQAYVRLLVVDPEERGRGHGHELVRAAEADARAAGHTSLQIGADAPFFLWAGAPSTEIELLCLLERHHYQRVDTNYDMTIDLVGDPGGLPADPGGHRLATSADRDELDAWATKHWPNWRCEMLRALGKGNLVVAHDDVDISAICAFEVNRAGFLGPVASRPDLIGKGAGRAGLVGALHELRRRGRDSVEVAWVGPIVPYAQLGGRVSTVYFVYRKDLP
jgi:GNAT superfamily N-acetyltransferase